MFRLNSKSSLGELADRLGRETGALRERPREMAASVSSDDAARVEEGRYDQAQSQIRRGVIFISEEATPEPTSSCRMRHVRATHTSQTGPARAKSRFTQNLVRQDIRTWRPSRYGLLP